MVKSAAVTLEEVQEAISTLRKEGKTPTVSSVRDLIGRGSFSTLTPLVKPALEMERQIAVEVSELPDEVVKASERAAGSIYAVALREATAKIDAIEASAKKSVEQAESRMADALQEISRLEREVETCVESRDAAMKGREETVILLQKESVRAERAEALLESIEKRLIDVQADADRRIEGASRHAAKAAEEAAELRGGIAAIEKRLIDVQADADRRIEGVSKHAAKASEEAAELRGQIGAMKSTK